MDMEFIVPVVLFISFTWMVKALSDNKTKRMIIDKVGLNENIRFLYDDSKKHLGASLKWGMVLSALGIALFIYRLFFYRESEEVMFGLLFLAAGLGLIVYYFAARQKQTPPPQIEKKIEEQ